MLISLVFVCLQAKASARKTMTLFGRSWDRIVLDEGHAIRNKKTILHQSLLKLATPDNFKWVLSATPLQNKKADMEAIKNWIGFEVSMCVQAFGSMHLTAGI